MSWSLDILLKNGLGDAAIKIGEPVVQVGFNIEEACREMDAERDKLRRAFGLMLEHICDGGGERPCSQMWFQDVAEEALKDDKGGVR